MERKTLGASSTKKVFKEVIIVEGKYDKQRLESLVDATIIATGGFRVFKDEAARSLICRLARKCGVIILTDSDGAGFKIRNFIKNILMSHDNSCDNAGGGDGGIVIKQAYIPTISGKERRKRVPGKEELLGVEGMDDATIISALENASVVSGLAGASGTGERVPGVDADVKGAITKQDFYDIGLIGKDNSHAMRREVMQQMGLPLRLSTNALIDVLNRLTTLDELKEMVGKFII
ncbi:MAG: DUF4093 domain-containing protein [Clostridiales bacterium]|jgi:ribonuclease M5|nr:DUF4093 domain-containing protein [Clostridiales bacterium]